MHACRNREAEIPIIFRRGTIIFAITIWQFDGLLRDAINPVFQTCAEFGNSTDMDDECAGHRSVDEEGRRIT